MSSDGRDSLLTDGREMVCRETDGRATESVCRDPDVDSSVVLDSCEKESDDLVLGGDPVLDAEMDVVSELVLDDVEMVSNGHDVDKDHYLLQ